MVRSHPGAPKFQGSHPWSALLSPSAIRTRPGSIPPWRTSFRGRSSMEEPQLPKLMTGVRFPSPAPVQGALLMKKNTASGSLKPRNGHLAGALFRKAGAHGKTRKAERQAARMKFQRTLKSGNLSLSDVYPIQDRGSQLDRHRVSGCSSGGRARRSGRRGRRFKSFHPDQISHPSPDRYETVRWPVAV